MAACIKKRMVEMAIRDSRRRLSFDGLTVEGAIEITSFVHSSAPLE